MYFGKKNRMRNFILNFQDLIDNLQKLVNNDVNHH
jgi:hypothetical protein